MDIPQKVIRENHNGILIEAEALIDFDIGCMRCLKDDYREDKDKDIIDIDYITRSSEDLIKDKMNDKDFIYKSFSSDIDKETVGNVFNDYINHSLRYVIEFAPEVPAISRLISVMDRNKTNVGHCVVVARKLEIIPYLKNRFPNLTILEASGRENFDFKPYARFIVEDINRLTEYGIIEFTHITVMNYAKNFKTYDNGKTTLSPDPVLLYGHTNEFGIIDPLIGGS